MDPLTEELLEELDAYRPAWRREFKCVGAAAQAAGVLGLYTRWTQTVQGRQYLAQYSLTPDYEAAAKTLVELENEPDPSLPFNLRNFAWMTEENWLFG